MNDSLLVHVLNALKNLLHVPNNFFFCEVVVVANFLKQLTSRYSAILQCFNTPVIENCSTLVKQKNCPINLLYETTSFPKRDLGFLSLENMQLSSYLRDM